MGETDHAQTCVQCGKPVGVFINVVLCQKCLDLAVRDAKERKVRCAEFLKDARETLKELVEVGGPHEDVDCPEDDTCSCKLAKRVNGILKEHEIAEQKGYY